MNRTGIRSLRLLFRPPVRMHRCVLFLLVLLLVAGTWQPGRTTAAEAPAAGKGDAAAKAAEEEPLSITRHRMTIGGKTIDYTATAGMLPLLNDKGETEARIFSVTYTIERKPGDPPRPLLFVFNGGPGSSAVWLHLGALGPRRVRLLADGNMPPPPFTIEDNDATWLDLADLVFVDPVGAGYSRAASEEKKAAFTSVEGDIESLSRFIRFYLGRFERWDSPLFLMGESYGTTRVAGLSHALSQRGVALSGVVLMSPVLNFQTVSFDQENDLPYILHLPAYAATAWYHGRLAPGTDLLKLLDETQRWAGKEYRLALAAGGSIPPEERTSTAQAMARFTGLDTAFIERRNLRVDNITFARELLRDRGKVVGFLDSRFTAFDVNPGSAMPAFDPTLAIIRPPFTTMFNTYVRRELDYHSDREYFILAEGIGRWDWGAKNCYADTSEDLKTAMSRNPYLKVLVVGGYFDLATPYPVIDYTLSHLYLPPEAARSITIHRYHTGHMPYLDREALGKLKTDAAAFFAEALGSGKPP